MSVGVFLLVENNLDETFAVSQVNERERTEISSAMHPAHQLHNFACMFRSEIAGIMSAS